MCGMSVKRTDPFAVKNRMKKITACTATFFFYKLINMKHDKCRNPECNKSASFGFMKRMYCKEHMEPGMWNVSNQMCKFEDCSKQATFGFPEGPSCIACSEHKLSGIMVHSSQKKRRTELIMSSQNSSHNH